MLLGAQKAVSSIIAEFGLGYSETDAAFRVISGLGLDLSLWPPAIVPRELAKAPQSLSSPRSRSLVRALSTTRLPYQDRKSRDVSRPRTNFSLTGRVTLTPFSDQRLSSSLSSTPALERLEAGAETAVGGLRHVNLLLLSLPCPQNTPLALFHVHKKGSTHRHPGWCFGVSPVRS